MTEANDLGPTNIEAMTGFTAGTMITTLDGLIPVEWLRAGDRILTRDRGFQPVA
ncbi:Hint domain-containing protein [Pseudogemmobacter sp. W21_MBD1_M6]|uniref:Hint domain-containing protein n=1 Tax=Pseudogemmobacter sp. W21_MBD1_M6 TaxID=3240271 RepID=UPI003F995557